MWRCKDRLQQAMSLTGFTQKIRMPCTEVGVRKSATVNASLNHNNQKLWRFFIHRIVISAHYTNSFLSPARTNNVLCLRITLSRSKVILVTCFAFLSKCTCIWTGRRHFYFFNGGSVRLNASWSVDMIRWDLYLLPY
jgi:hypothetical protein